MTTWDDKVFKSYFSFIIIFSLSYNLFIKSFIYDG